MKDKEYPVQILQLSILQVSKTLIFSPKNEYMDQTRSVLHQQNIWTNQVLYFGRFQNECTGMVIEPRVVQFWSEIIIVISALINYMKKYSVLIG